MLERKLSAGASERLAARRRRGRKRAAILLGILALVLLGTGIWFSWQPSTRITNITVSSGDVGVIAHAHEVLSGSFFGILPKNSFFFLPERLVRTRILKEYPSVAAVSISRTSFNDLAITLHNRTPVARWCGDVYPTPLPVCYLFDTTGLIYETATSTDAVANPYLLYTPLGADEQGPIGAHVEIVGQLPAIFDFAREIGTLGSLVRDIGIR